MAEETKLLVVYVGVAGLRSEDIEYFVQNVTKRLQPKTFEGEIIVIPTQSPDTRVECINPKYVTDDALIKEHTEKMKELHENLQHQMEQLKQDNNG